jgi:hypothetical protein
MQLDLTDEEATALLSLLNRAIDDDRYPLVKDPQTQAPPKRPASLPLPHGTGRAWAGGGGGLNFAPPGPSPCRHTRTRAQVRLLRSPASSATRGRLTMPARTGRPLGQGGGGRNSWPGIFGSESDVDRPRKKRVGMPTHNGRSVRSGNDGLCPTAHLRPDGFERLSRVGRGQSARAR